MKIILKRKLVTNFTDKRTNQTYEIITPKFECEPNYIFEKRHRLKVKAKKYWLRKIVK